MDTIGDRIKNNYENVARHYLTRRTPVIIRIDGKAFHTLTRNMNKPFDTYFIGVMQTTAEYLVKNVQGAKLAYVQSDEISLFLTDYDELQTDAWFGYNKSKMESVSASMATAIFGKYVTELAFFDSRAFNIPKEEVVNYFVWRGRDWERNSLSMFSRAYYSSEELHGKNKEQQHEMLYQKGVNWADLPPFLKNGTYFLTDGSKRDDILPTYESISQLIKEWL